MPTKSECFEIIIAKFNETKKRCTNPETMVDMNLDDFINPISYVTATWSVESGPAIEESFIQHLKLLPYLVSHPDFEQFFNKITAYLCLQSVNCVAQSKFNSQLLYAWEAFLRHVPSHQKSGAFRFVNTKKFQEFTKILTGPVSFSQQFKVLEILCSYADTNAILNLIDKSAPGLTLNQQIYGDIASSVSTKQLLLCRLNKRIQHKSVATDFISQLKFGETIVCFKQDDGFIHLNLVNKTIELLMPHDDVLVKVEINASNVDKIQIHDIGICNTNHVKFELNSTPQFETDSEHEVDISVFMSSVIEVTFPVGFGFRKTFFQPFEMFGIDAEVIDKQEPMDEEDLDEDNSDDECQIIGVAQIDVETETSMTNEYTPARTPVGSPDVFDDSLPLKRKSSAKVEVPLLVINEAEPPVKRLRSSRPFSVQAPNTSRIFGKSPPRRVYGKRYLPEPKETIELSDDARSQSRSPSVMEVKAIETSTFYSKPKDTKAARLVEPKVEVKVDPKAKNKVQPKAKPKAKRQTKAKNAKSLPAPKARSIRAAARKAVENIKKEANDVFEFSAFDMSTPKPKANKRKTTGVLVETTNNAPFRTANSRKLFNPNEYGDDDVVEVPEKKPKKEMVIVDELTSPTFRSSMMNNGKQNQRILENMGKINESMNRRQNVSFSYRTPKRPIAKTQPDSTNVQNDQIIDVCNDDNIDNIDNNGNHTAIAHKGNCIKELLTESATVISNAANQIISVVNASSTVCNCEAPEQLD